MAADDLFNMGIQQGNPPLLRRAWAAYEQALALSGPSLDAYLQLGRVFFHLSLLGATTDEDFTRAQEVARRAFELAPEQAQPHHIMGLVLAGKGRYLDAMSELRLAMELRPPNEFLLCDVASIHLALHQPAETIRLLEGKSLRNGWSFVVLAIAWLQEGQRGKALMNLLKARHLGMTGYWSEHILDRIRPGLVFPTMP